MGSFAVHGDDCYAILFSDLHVSFILIGCLTEIVESYVGVQV